MTLKTAQRRVMIIMQYEPSWFAECMSALGIFLWGAFALLTDDYDVTGMACIMPLFCLVLGPTRIAVLFSLRPEFRVLVACIGFVFWVVVASSLHHRSGFLPAEGMAVALAFGDVLTVGKFSLVAWLRTGARDAS